MPTAKVTKNVSAAIGGGNVLCSTLISIKTKAWLYSFHRLFRHDKNRLSMTIPASVPIVLVSQGFFPYIRTDI